MDRFEWTNEFRLILSPLYEPNEHWQWAKKISPIEAMSLPLDAYVIWHSAHTNILSKYNTFIDKNISV